MVDGNEDSSGDVYKGSLEGDTDEGIDPQDHSHTIEPPSYRHQSCQTTLNEQEEERTSGNYF